MTKILKEDGKTIIQTESRIDTLNASQFEADIQHAVRHPGANVELDCTDLTFIASSGLRIVQKTMRIVMAGKGTFKMTNVRPDVYKVLAMTGFTSLFKFK